LACFSSHSFKLGTIATRPRELVLAMLASTLYNRS
jgi:hypothetical protein